jgi:hypothetical protein
MSFNYFEKSSHSFKYAKENIEKHGITNEK